MLAIQDDFRFGDLKPEMLVAPSNELEKIKGKKKGLGRKIGIIFWTLKYL